VLSDWRSFVIGPVVATRLLGRTGRASRFPSSSAFANYAGVAPVEVASADQARHRLPRGGDRLLNLALHIAALTQVRMRGSLGRAYYDRKIAEGKTRNEPMNKTSPRNATPSPRWVSRPRGSTSTTGSPGPTGPGPGRARRWLPAALAMSLGGTQG
jgi:transposase